MPRRSLACLLFACASFGACDGPPAPLDGSADAGTDAATPPPRTREELPAPGPLVAGIAEVRIPAPLGIGTMGFNGVTAAPSVTPFADRYPGTVRAHGVLTFRAIALSRGERHEVILVRMDTVGVFQQLREAVLDELERRTGRSFDDALVLAGNHTHSGPGRLLYSTGALALLADSFFPEFYDRVVDALADVVERAIADQAPAELGYAIAYSSDGHQDRRCENDPLDQPQEIPDLPLVAVRREGRIDAIVASYAYHGTVLGIDDHTLSGDMGAVVEQKIEERFDHPVMVLFFNSWGADMAPGNAAPDPSAVGAEQPSGFERMHLLGDRIAEAVMPVVSSIEFEAEPALRARTYRVRLDRESIGYDADTFRYPHGGVYCSGEGNCEAVAPIEGLDRRCLPIGAGEGLPKQTMLSAGQIGDLYFVTAPGEWSTALAAGVLDHVRAVSGGDAMLIGYANDYTGYSLNEADWWQGGYEASGAIWGPRQGDYLAARLREAFETYYGRWNEPPWIEPARVEPFSGYTYEPYHPEEPVDLGTIAQDVPATATLTDVVRFVVRGSDPWLGLPLATLEREDGGSFAPVLRANGEPVDSASYDFWIDLTTSPTYAEQRAAASRTFEWAISFPVGRRSTSNIPPLEGGTYRFAVRLPSEEGEVVVHTGTFAVVAP
ncbi:MAG TPA: neutral/alkaline non-lysosomal ceramidase N-terminal domain-containing protein [Sandaracinaceae bacterium]